MVISSINLHSTCLTPEQLAFPSQDSTIDQYCMVENTMSSLAGRDVEREREREREMHIGPTTKLKDATVTSTSCIKAQIKNLPETNPSPPTKGYNLY